MKKDNLEIITESIGIMIIILITFWYAYGLGYLVRKNEEKAKEISYIGEQYGFMD